MTRIRPSILKSMHRLRSTSNRVDAVLETCLEQPLQALQARAPEGHAAAKFPVSHLGWNGNLAPTLCTALQGPDLERGSLEVDVGESDGQSERKRLIGWPRYQARGLEEASALSSGRLPESVTIQKWQMIWAVSTRSQCEQEPMIASASQTIRHVRKEREHSGPVFRKIIRAGIADACEQLQNSPVTGVAPRPAKRLQPWRVMFFVKVTMLQPCRRRYSIPSMT